MGGYKVLATALAGVVLFQAGVLLGMMGSQTKVDRLFAELRAEGFAEASLEKVHAPIGLPIRSKTPAEIAISVAAQLIQVRNTQQNA